MASSGVSALVGRAGPDAVVAVVAVGFYCCLSRQHESTLRSNRLVYCYGPLVREAAGSVY